MEFEDVKHGDIYYDKSDIGMIRIWIVYKVKSDEFVTFFWNSTSDKLTRVYIPKEVFNDSDYKWQEKKNDDNSVLGRFSKKIIREVFKYGVG